MASELRKSKADGQFWEQFLRLEELSHSKYQPVVEKHGLSMELALVYRIIMPVFMVLHRFFPRYTLNYMSDATNKYIPQLEELEQLAPSEEADYFRYVVLQEQAQAEGMMILRRGNPQEAADYLKAFIDSQQ